MSRRAAVSTEVAVRLRNSAAATGRRQTHPSVVFERAPGESLKVPVEQPTCRRPLVGRLGRAGEPLAMAQQLSRMTSEACTTTVHRCGRSPAEGLHTLLARQGLGWSLGRNNRNGVRHSPDPRQHRRGCRHRSGLTRRRGERVLVATSEALCAGLAPVVPKWAV
jgi:hypothetical protein